MANIKKENKENVDNAQVLENKADPKDLIIEQLQQQMLEMQKVLIQMQSNKIITNNTPKNNNTYEIGTRFVNGVSVFSPRKEVEKEIPFNKTIQIDDYELNMLLKSNFVKDWFEKDIIFFTEEYGYSFKKIRKQYNLDDDSLIELIITKGTPEVMSVLNEMTKKFKDDPMIHCLFYRIVELCQNGKLSTMPYETRQEIEKMFGFKIGDAQMLFRGFREIK